MGFADSQARALSSLMQIDKALADEYRQLAARGVAAMHSVDVAAKAALEHFGVLIAKAGLENELAAIEGYADWVTVPDNDAILAGIAGLASPTRPQ